MDEMRTETERTNRLIADDRYVLARDPTKTSSRQPPRTRCPT